MPFTGDAAQYSYYKEYEIPAASIISTMSDVVAHFARTDSDIKAAARSDGNDILFTDTSDNKLPHHLVHWDSATGRLQARVLIDVTASTAYTLRVYYGKPDQSTSEENISDTYPVNDWEAAYTFDGSSLVSDAASGLGVSFTPDGAPTEVWSDTYGVGASFDGVDDGYTAPDVNFGEAQCSFMLLIDADLDDSSDWRLFTKQTSGSAGNHDTMLGTTGDGGVARPRTRQETDGSHAGTLVYFAGQLVASPQLYVARWRRNTEWSLHGLDSENSNAFGKLATTGASDNDAEWTNSASLELAQAQSSSFVDCTIYSLMIAEHYLDDDDLETYWEVIKANPLSVTTEEVANAGYVSSSESTDSGTTHTVTMPSGQVEGNELIAVLACTESVETAPSFSAPAGWTEIEDVDTHISAISSCRVQAFKRSIPSGGVSDTDFTSDATAGSAHIVVQVRGQTDVDTVSVSTGNDDAPISPSVSVTEDSVYVLRIMCSDDNDIGSESFVYPNDSGHNDRNIISLASPGNGLVLGLSDETETSGASTGAATWSLTASEEWAAITITMKQPANETEGNASLTAQAALAAQSVATGRLTGGVGFAGEGGVDALRGPVLTVDVAAAMTGQSSAETSSALSGAATMASGGAADAVSAAVLTGDVVLAAEGAPEATAAASLTAQSALGPAGAARGTAAASLTAQSEQGATGASNTAADASLTASCAQAADGSSQATGVVSLTSDAALAADSAGVSTADLIATSDLSATGRANAEALSSLSAAISVDVAGSATTITVGVSTAGLALVAGGSSRVVASGTLSIKFDLAANSAGASVAAMTGNAVAAAAGRAGVTAISALAADVDLAGAGQALVTATGDLSLTAAIEAGGSAGKQTAASLTSQLESAAAAGVDAETNASLTAAASAEAEVAAAAVTSGVLTAQVAASGSTLSIRLGHATITLQLVATGVAVVPPAVLPDYADVRVAIKDAWEAKASVDDAWSATIKLTDAWAVRMKIT